MFAKDNVLTVLCVATLTIGACKKEESPEIVLYNPPALKMVACEKIDRLEIKYDPDHHPNNSAVGYSKIYRPTDAESETIMNTKLGVVDGKSVTIRDYFAAQLTGGGDALLKQNGMPKPAPVRRGGTTKTKIIHCEGFKVTDRTIPLPINWAATQNKPTPRPPKSIHDSVPVRPKPTSTDP